MVEIKPSRYPEGNKSKNSTDKNKGQAFKTKRYRCKKMRTKTQGPELKSDTDFKGLCSDLEGCVFDLGLRASDKFARTMKDMERYLRAIYSNSCYPVIIIETPETLPNP